MLVRITNRCTFQCTHCIARATPEGEHMTEENLVKTACFVRDTGLPLVIISGGEPTEHPQLLEFVSMLISDLQCKIILLSNGLFFEEKPDLAKTLLSLPIQIQVMRDPKYYPREVKVPQHPNILYEDTLTVLSPQGRALDNKLECNRRSPACFNLRSFIRAKNGDFVEALMMHRMRGGMCTPSINVDGTIVAGEAPDCHPIGNLDSSFEDLGRALFQMRCDKCGLIYNLDQQHKRAIGEAVLIL